MNIVTYHVILLQTELHDENREGMTMKLRVTIITVVLMLAVYPAVATESRTAPAGSEQKSQAKPAKKSRGTMEKTGDSIKSGWHKFTESVKHGSKEPPCKQEQKSLKRCD